ARARRPGALRELALIFDEELAAQDASFDGAVAAWQVVRAHRTRLGGLWGPPGALTADSLRAASSVRT
ncbi:MAG: hypothetical protein LC749_14235, partial [Actinobacteria bacterium]|nr:hypothetical protein [Actinomycetota bacterium]